MSEVTNSSTAVDTAVTVGMSLKDASTLSLDSPVID